MTPIRPVFLRYEPALLVPLTIIAAALIIGVVFLARGWLKHDTEPFPPRDYVSADGKAVCYVFPQGVSCIPVWLLDRPNNWVVMYPHSTPTGKVKK